MIFELIDKPNDQSPNFVAGYFQTLDDFGHLYGPNSTQIQNGLQQVDQVLRNLTKGLEDRNQLKNTNIMIVSDHGMADVKKYVDLNQIISNFTQKIFVYEFQSKATRTSVVLNMRAINSSESSQIYSLLKNSTDMNCYLKNEIPNEWHIKNTPRTGDIMCFMKIGNVAIIEDQIHWYPNGEHGYDIIEPEMKAIFIGLGPSFLNNVKLDEFQNIELYNVMCKLLAINPSPNNGTLDFISKVLK